MERTDLSESDEDLSTKIVEELLSTKNESIKSTLEKIYKFCSKRDLFKI